MKATININEKEVEGMEWKQLAVALDEQLKTLKNDILRELTKKGIIKPLT